MCPECRDIRTELASIVIHQRKGASAEMKSAINEKGRRRDELLQLLSSHACPDRDSGRLTVPTGYSRVLSLLTVSRAKPQESKAQSDDSLRRRGQ